MTIEPPGLSDHRVIEPQEYRERQQAIAAAMVGNGLAGRGLADRGLDVHGLAAVLCVSRGGGTFDRHGEVFWLTGHYQPFVYLPDHPPHWSGRSHTAAVIGSDGRTVLCVSTPTEPERIPAVDDVRHGEDFAVVVADAIREVAGGGAIGLAGADVLPLAYARTISGRVPGLDDAVDFDAVFQALRRRKSPAEQTLIRRAAGVGRQAMDAFHAAAAPGVRESDAVAAATSVIVAEGGAVYLAAASSGPHSGSYVSKPVAGFSTRTLAAGDLVRFDLIAAVDGYLTDFGRTVVVDEPSARQDRLLHTLHTALDAVVDAVRPGVTVTDIVAAGDQRLAELGVVHPQAADAAAVVHPEKGYGDDRILAAYPAHWGHGLGLGWERPWLIEDEELTIEDGTCLAVERALFMPGVGGAAAEQNLLITSDGVELLTAGPNGRWS